ncbi:MFS transporter [Bifidobacterium aemilianum]|uniref:MFS transporter n=1 Tax=Bifidobacterium aemilianum TaxID=2493120 RepID=A0A366K9X1_9BIFI|nr:MFS transporter [Bifidobacterium aemilianum]
MIFISCCLLSFVGYGLIVNTPGLYYPILSQQLGVNRTKIAFASTIMNLTGAATMLFAGKLLKHVDSRLLISICILACSAIFLSQSFFTQLWQFYLSFALLGVAYVIPVTLAPSVLLSNWFNDKLGLVMGIALGLSGLGGMVFNPVVSAWIVDLGWRPAYQLTGLLLAVCILPFSILVMRFMPNTSKGEHMYGAVSAGQPAADQQEPDQQTKQTKQTESEIPGMAATKAYRTPTFLLLIACFVLLQWATGMVQHVAGYETSRGMGLKDGALVVSGIMLGAAIGKASIGFFLDRFKTEPVVLVYCALGLGGWALMILATSPTPSTIAGGLAGLGQGVLLVALPWLTRKAFGQRDYAEILSILTMSGVLSVALANTVNGGIFDLTGSYLPALLINLVCYVLAAAASITAYRLRPQIHEQ